MTDEHGRVIELFTAAAQVPPGERAAFLDEACAGDEVLRRRIEALLKSHDSAGEFMEEPPTWLLHEGRPRVTVGEKPGDWIGSYQLIRQIGEGGCGVVFVAEQEEPIRRRVALKVIKPGMDTRSVIARFEAERQALALMDHPNIAHVLEAGATESGRPYFVMELVEGEKISDYCNRHALPLETRLQLFVQVCDAIEHAHQKGIIHRDIKPSNILVITGREGRPVPKVIDFGIAKATTGQQLTDKTLFTSWGTLMGTPAYMSPEQATLASAELDTRTDIYSLGVVLYELLTGAPPFDTHELLKAGFDEVRRVIRDEEPVRPSTKLGTMLAEDLATISKHHAAPLPKLIREMRGDLDWIVMKALEKDRRRRYATTNALSMDIGRYLAGEAVAARPPSAAYKFRKLFLRNRLWFGAAATVALVFVIGFISVALALKREKAARIETDRSRRQAEADKTQSQQATRFLEEMLQGVGPSVARGDDTKMLEEILEKTAARLPVELADQPAIRAKLQTLLGVTYRDLGQYPQAEAMLRESLATRTRLFGEENEATSDTMVELGHAIDLNTANPEAESYIRRGLAVRRKLFGEEHMKVAECYFILGSIQWGRQEIPEAEGMLRKALEMQTRLLGDKSAELGDSLLGVGTLLYSQGKLGDAERMFRQALANCEPVLSDDHPLVTRCVNNLAVVLAVQGRDAEAEPLLRRSLATRRKIYKEGHREISEALHGLARLLIRLSRFDEAETAAREALAMARKAKGDTHEETLEILRDLIKALLLQHKFEETDQLFADLLPPERVPKPEYSGLLFERCDAHARRGRWQEAADDARVLMKQSPENHDNYHLLAPLLVQLGESAEYQKLCREILVKFGATTDIHIADRMAKDCLILPSPDLDLKAVAAMADVAIKGGSDTPAAPYFQFCKGLAEYRLGHHEEAVKWAQLASAGSFPDVKACAKAVMAMSQFELGRLEDARGALAECRQLIVEQLPKPGQELGHEWRESIILQTLRSEAERMIERESP